MKVNRYTGASKGYPLALPLVDLLILVSFFFVLIALYQPARPNLNFTASNSQDSNRTTVVRLDSTGQLYLNGQWRSVREAAEVLRRIQTSGPDRSVVVIVDPGARFSTIQSVLEQLEKNNVQPTIEVTIDRPGTGD